MTRRSDNGGVLSNTQIIKKTTYTNHQKNIIWEGSRNDWFVHPRYRTYE